MRLHRLVATVIVATSIFLSGTAAVEARNPNYQAQIYRTSYGIPHIKAEDWGSLGYGYGYAFAQDNACVLARDVLAATGTQAQFFGPGSQNATVASDAVYRMVNSATRVNEAWAAVDQETRDLLNGYAAGYNRYLKDTGVANLAADCRGQAWVRPITGFDAMKVLRKLMVRASTGNFVPNLAGAVPPVAASVAWSSGADATPATGDSAALEQSLRLAANDAMPDFSPERFGSNALALGSDLTGGAGALLGNPHFPWQGIERFYAAHLTIPGRYDVMGASIYGFPMINIGFNRDVAWSHTVSTGRRFIVRELAIAPGNPRAYIYEGKVENMTPEVVTVQVRLPNGAVVGQNVTFWQTRFGPMWVLPSSQLPDGGALWTTTRGYALTDANLDNSRAFKLYREMGTSRSVPELEAALKRHVALPWVNTIAADSQGNAFYGDITVVPHITNAQLSDAQCKGSALAQTISAGLRIYTTSGALAKCDPGTDADAPVPGIFGAGNLPSLVRRDYVHNANDSYWLTNPNQLLEGYSRLIGADERSVQGLRTRVGHDQVNDRMAGIDGLPGSGFSRQWLQDVLFSNRHYSADIMIDGVLQLCATESNSVTVGGATVNVAPACSVLSQWDRRNNTSSVGTHVWTEFWNRARNTASLYAVPFNANDPVNTPRGVNLASAAVRSALMGHLGTTVKFLADNGIPLDRPWGQIQFDTRNGKAIPIHGGSGVSGVWNAKTVSNVVPNVGYTPILAGSSYIQAVTFKDSGPDARAIVTYSQSTDPANPHYADMTGLYSNYGWVKMPFAEREIRQDPNLKSLTIREAR